MTEVWCEKHKHFAYQSDNSHRGGLKEKPCHWCGSFEQICSCHTLQWHPDNMKKWQKMRKKRQADGFD